jgi:hypothetical protein
VAGGRAEEHLAAFAAHMTQGLLACWTALGLEVMVELMELEVTERPAQGQAQPGPDRDAAASQPGTVTLGGRRLGMGRPGVSVRLPRHTTLDHVCHSWPIRAMGIVDRDEAKS